MSEPGMSMVTIAFVNGEIPKVTGQFVAKDEIGITLDGLYNHQGKRFFFPWRVVFSVGWEVADGREEGR